MNAPTFSIDKTSSYLNGKRDYESFAIHMNGNTICTIHREKAEELFNQLKLALNDRKEVDDEERK